MSKCIYVAAGLLGATLALQLGGCPTSGEGSRVIAGGTGDVRPIGSTASVVVLSPGDVDLSITSGTPVEVVWQLVSTTTFATVDVFFDVDEDPENDNEIFIQRGLPITENTLIAETTLLEAGLYFVGVALNERGVLSVFDYSDGRLSVNQSPLLTFTSPREAVSYDRSLRITPTVDVAWTLDDPDNTVFTQIFLDPDGQPNGDELLLRESTSQTGDQFSFDLPTATLDAGTWRILAIVDDGVDQTAFYAPGTIRLRARLAGFVDLRSLDQTDTAVQGAIFEGFNPRDNAGSFVASMGDLDADGFDDFIILSQFGKPRFISNSSRTGVGEAYQVFGRAERYSGRINLNSTGTLFRGNIFTGVPEAVDPVRPSRGITSFTVLSDWDNDGLRDFAFGLPFTDSIVERPANRPLDADGYFRSGSVVICASSCLRPDLNFPGGSVVSLGDVGTRRHVNRCPPPEPQCPHSFFGPKAPISSGGQAYTYMWRYFQLCDAATPNGGSIAMGCRISSNEFGDAFGETVSAYQFDGLIMSAPNRDPKFGTSTNAELGVSIPSAGTVHLFFTDRIGGDWPWDGKQSPPINPNVAAYTGLFDPITVDTLPQDGPYHYIIDDFFNYPIDGGPGYFVDADNGDPCFREHSGATPDANRTVRIYGQQPSGRLGGARGVGDFNADGIEDILIGNPLANDGDGSVYVMFGRLPLLVRNGELALEELNLPLNSGGGPARIFDGVRIVGSSKTRLGESQAAAGDFNNDGISDLLIGSPLLNNRKGGVAVFFGSRDVINFTQEEIPFEEVPARGLGVVFVGEQDEDLAGARVAGAGDVDGDGNDDILIAAPNRSVTLDLDLDGITDVNRTNCGVVYLIYGSPKLQGTISLSEIGTEQLPGATFIGRNSAEFLGGGIGEQGDRSLGIAPAGDVDGDGRIDLLLTSVTASPRDRVQAGEAYLVYGSGD
ncbi:MAG: FG-GAP repeat protein [Phycisphaerae bacterium]|jgi:hypothetical protein